MDSIRRSSAAARSWLTLLVIALGSSQAVAQSEPSEQPAQEAPQAQPGEAGEPEQSEGGTPAAEPSAQGEPAAEAPPAEAAAAEPPPEPPRSDEANTITVIGTRISETAGSAHIISEKKLQRFAYDDPTAVLLSIPGVYARGEDGVGMRNNIGLRGVNPDRSKKITLLEDGILFAPAPYSAPAAYFFPLITRMSGVEVLKGPAAIAYGPYTIAGAINLITRKIPNSTSAGLDLGAGQYGYGKVHAYAGGMTEDHIGFLIEGVHLRNTGFKHLQSGGETGSIRNEWMGKLSYVLDPSARIVNEFALKVSYQDEDADESYTGLTDADFKVDPLLRYSTSQLDHIGSHRTSLVLSHEVDFSPQVSLTTALYEHHYYRVWRRAKFFGGKALYEVLAKPEENQVYAEILRGLQASDPLDALQYFYIGPNERDFYSRGIDARLRAHFDTGAFAHRFETGVALHHDNVKRRHYSDAYLVYMDGTLAPAGQATLTEVFEKVDAIAFTAHLTDGITWGPLTLTPGVRFEYIQFSVENYMIPGPLGKATKNTNVILPGVGAYLHLFEGFGVLAGVSRGFSPPVPETQPLVMGEPLSQAPLAKPESSINYEFGARYMLGPTRIEAIGFYNDYSNLTDVCTQSSGCDVMNMDRQFSAGAAIIYGVEGYVEHTFALGAVRLPIGLSYTYTEGTFDETFHSDDPIFGDVEKGDHMPYLPEHQLRGTIAVESPSLGGEFGVMYMSAMREEAGKEPAEMSPVRTDEQLVFDVGLNYHINDWWSVHGNLRNMFNKLAITGHRPQGARPNAPRWLQFGTKLTY